MEKVSIWCDLPVDQGREGEQSEAALGKGNIEDVWKCK